MILLTLASLFGNIAFITVIRRKNETIDAAYRETIFWKQRFDQLTWKGPK